MLEDFLDESFYLTRCCQLIEEKWQNGKCKNWQNGDYKKLSQMISTASRISISPDTLKRLFGKVKTYRSYNPQTETKKALAIFLNYNSWEEFKRDNQLPPGEAKGDGPAPSATVSLSELSGTPTAAFAPGAGEPVLTTQSGNRRYTRFFTWMALLAVGLAVGAGAYFWSASVPPEPFAGVPPAAPGEKKVVFKGKLLRGKVPHTVVFQYDVSHLDADSIYIDYGYHHFGYTDRELLPKQQHTITHYYHIPGFYQATLKAGKQVLAALDVKVLSDDWTGTVYSRSNGVESIDQKVLRHHYPESRAYVSPRELQAAGIDSNQINWVEWSNVRYFGIPGDSFVLESRFRNNPAEGGMACLESIIRVLGEHNLLRLQFTQPGCSRWAIVQFGETELDGKFTDLSPFSTDVSQWRTVRMEVKNKRVSVFLENKLIYRTAYRESLGEIRGIIYNFRGCGSVDYVKLFDTRNALVYEDDFDQ